MVYFDSDTKGNISKYNVNWPQISDHPYRISMIGHSGSGKTNTLLNLTNH